MRNTTKNVLKNLLLCAAMFCLMMVMAMPAHAATSNGAELLSLINNERAANGIAPLTIGSTELNAAAQARAEELATDVGSRNDCECRLWIYMRCVYANLQFRHRTAESIVNSAGDLRNFFAEKSYAAWNL